MKNQMKIKIRGRAYNRVLRKLGGKVEHQVLKQIYRRVSDQDYEIIPDLQTNNTIRRGILDKLYEEI